MPETAYCRGHEVLAQYQESDAVPKDKHGRPLPGFFTFLRLRTPDDDTPDDD